MFHKTVEPIYLLPPPEHRARKLALIILSLVPFLFGSLAIWLGQDNNWDLRNYHWYNAYAFLNGRYAMDMLPSQTPWFYNPTIDVPFYLLAMHAPAVVAGFVLGSLQGLNFVLLFMLAHAGLRIANPRQKVIVCAGLSLLGMLGGGGIAQIGTTFYDNITSLGLFLSAVLIVSNTARLQQERWHVALRLSLLFGIPSGMAMGLKLPCFTFCVGLCGAILLANGNLQRRVVLSFGFGLGVLIGLAVTMGHWAWFLQTHFGSPFFPYFNDIFKAPLAPLSSARDMQYVPRTLHDFFLFPFIIADSPFRAGEIPWRDWRLPILYVLLPVSLILRLIFGRSRAASDGIAEPVVARYLLWAITLSYFIWLKMFGIYRYAVPIEMIAPLLITISVGMLPMRVSARSMLTAFILLVIAVTIQPGNWGRSQTWFTKFMDIDVPPIAGADKTMLLMAGFEPYAHIITQFPPEMPVVRVQSNFTSPDQDKAINQRIQAKVKAHSGPFLLVIPNWQHGVAAEALGYFHLASDWKACQTVRDRHYGDTLFDLCPVTRKRE